MAPRHHTVPQFYLRNFANEDKLVMLVDRDDLSRAHPTVIRKALAETGFYRLDPAVFDVEDSERPEPEIIEEHLSQFERAAAPGVYKLVRTGLRDLSQDDWYHLINFIALQSVRGNRFREDVRATATQALRAHLGSLPDKELASWLEERGELVTPERISDFREKLTGPNRPRLIPPKEFEIQQSIRFALGPVAERLADDRSWSLIEADQAQVLTSDEPVLWWAPGEDQIGFDSAQIVWFPLSRRHVLQLRSNAVDPESFDIPAPTSPAMRDTLVRFVNTEVATQAHRWIVHHPDDHPLDEIVLGPRTVWGDELVSVEEDGLTRRELYVHRRLPVTDDSTEAEAAEDQT